MKFKTTKMGFRVLFFQILNNYSEIMKTAFYPKYDKVFSSGIDQWIC